VVQKRVDLDLLARAYDRSAEGYDERFRALQRAKYRAAAGALPAAPGAGLGLDAGAGTGLFAEWLHDASEPLPEVRAALRAHRWVALDLSPGMLQRARGRPVLPVVGDLARPPLRLGSCALVAAFTSVLEERAAALGALAPLLRRGGALVATFLAGEAPRPGELLRWTGLELVAGPVPAGQDLLFIARRA
jgi:SAM-dependent methyltransferase